MMPNDSQAIEEAIDNIPIAEIENKLGSQDLTVQQEAYLLHIMHVRMLRKKLEQEAAELRERQEKIKYIHEIMQDINNAMDNKGGLDISKNPDLQQKLKDAKAMGIKLPEDTKTKFDPQECKRLVDNLNYSVEDWEKEDGMQMRKIQHLYTESEQSILIVKNTMASIDKPIRGMISGIRGG